MELLKPSKTTRFLVASKIRCLGLWKDHMNTESLLPTSACGVVHDESVREQYMKMEDVFGIDQAVTKERVIVSPIRGTFDKSSIPVCTPQCLDKLRSNSHDEVCQ